tara:strand:- start:1455 stop:2282 length:828 start_codon:yes stop_codon:yes gene_type:complete
MSGMNNDPIKKSKLIREVVASVALIPDQITRSVYVQEIAKKFDINERTISNELMKLMRSNITSKAQSVSPSTQKSHSNLDKKVQEEKSRVNNEKNTEYELDLIRLMVLFGTQEVTVPGEEDEEKKISVIELVCEELINDDLSFENEQYRMIYDLFLKGIEDNVLLTASYFKKLEDQKIVSFVSNLESNEIELSYNWIQKYNIYTKSESDNIYKSVMNSIYNFKYHKVDALILKIKKEIKEGNSADDELLNLLGEQMSYERIKKKLSDKLGRIILK